MVGPDACVDGEVIGPGDLVVQGTLRGKVWMGGTVRLEPGSHVRADIRAPRVVIVDGCSFLGQVDTSGAPRPTGSPGEGLLGSPASADSTGGA